MAKVAIEGASRANLFYVDPDDFTLPGIDYECGPDDPHYNPRNKMPVSEELVISIMRLGVFTPVEVTKTENGELVPVFGNQRIRAAREASRRLKASGKPGVKVPTKSPLKGAENGEIVEIAIAENEIRQESPAMVKAEMAAQILRHQGGNMAEAAKAFGLTLPNFKALLSLRESSAELKSAVTKGRVSASAAIEIAKLPRAEQPVRLEQIIAAGGTADIARTAVRQAKGRADRSRPTPALLRNLTKKRAELPLKCAANDAFWMAVGWVLGDLDARVVPGLSDAIKAAGEA
jgi:ParB-like chromosome segregation protein Spo0J